MSSKKTKSSKSSKSKSSRKKITVDAYVRSNHTSKSGKFVPAQYVKSYKTTDQGRQGKGVKHGHKLLPKVVGKDHFSKFGYNLKLSSKDRKVALDKAVAKLGYKVVIKHLTYVHNITGHQKGPRANHSAKFQRDMKYVMEKYKKTEDKKSVKKGGNMFYPQGLSALGATASLFGLNEYLKPHEHNKSDKKSKKSKKSSKKGMKKGMKGGTSIRDALKFNMDNGYKHTNILENKKKLKSNLGTTSRLLSINSLADPSHISSSYKNKKGGSMLSMLGNIVAPLGINALGTTAGLLALDAVMNPKHSKERSKKSSKAKGKSKKMRGGATENSGEKVEDMSEQNKSSGSPNEQNNNQSNKGVHSPNWDGNSVKQNQSDPFDDVENMIKDQLSNGMPSPNLDGNSQTKNNTQIGTTGQESFAQGGGCGCGVNKRQLRGGHKNKKNKHNGGSFVGALQGLVAPLGLSNLAATGALFAASQAVKSRGKSSKTKSLKKKKVSFSNKKSAKSKTSKR